MGQKLHEFQRLFDFHQNLVNFTAFDLKQNRERVEVRKCRRRTWNSEILWTLTGKQKTSSSVDLLFLMVDIGIPWETWRKAEEKRADVEHLCHVMNSKPKPEQDWKPARKRARVAAFTER